MKKSSGMASQCLVALGLTLLLGAATIPAAYADGEDTPLVEVVTTTTPPASDTPATGDAPVSGDAPVTGDGGLGTGDAPVSGDGGLGTGDAPVTGDAGLGTGDAPVTGDAGPETTDASTGTGVTPVQNQPVAENPLPAAPGLAPVIPSMPLQQRIEEVFTADSQEAVPATDEATATPAPSITAEAGATAVPIALPEPVSKTIDAVVATASGSPLYVQLLTVVVLIGAGIAYFRILGSKGTRVPSKSVK